MSLNANSGRRGRSPLLSLTELSNCESVPNVYAYYAILPERSNTPDALKGSLEFCSIFTPSPELSIVANASFGAVGLVTLL